VESKLALLAVVLCGAVVGGAVGFGAPMLFDRDIGGGLMASVLGIIGIPVGAIIATFLVRRHND